jgi:uncharacterized protein (TIGR01777 family)
MEKEVVLITGGTGLIGSVLQAILGDAGYEVILLSRNVKSKNSYLWDVEKNFIDKQAILKADHLIHLAGAGIADKPWTDERKKEIIDSRVDTSSLLVKSFKQHQKELKTVIAASAVGYYGFETSQHIYSETDKPAVGFLADTCVKWENATTAFNEVSERMVQLRIGVVLDKNGGALKKMAQPVHFYAGAAIGTGKQYMPWIHVKDLCNMILFALNNKNVQGVYNAVSSASTTNDVFTKAIGKALHKPILLPAIPAFVIKALFGDMAGMVLEGSRLSNEKIKNAGFRFQFDDIDLALIDLLKS